MKMLIGLTGRTGSGKTTAAQILTRLGAFVADCDKIGHNILFDPSIKEKLCKAFSESILDENKNIDRKALGKIVFGDKEKLSLLNHIMHTAIIKEALALCEESKKDICFIDGSELEASGVDERCSYVVVITADKDARLKRILERDNLKEDAALSRINSQTDYSKKAIIIKNNGNLKDFENAVTKVYNKFLEEINA